MEREVHVVPHLKANILVGMDIAGLEDMLIDLTARQVILRSCKAVRFPIEVKKRLDAAPLTRIVRSK